MKAVLFPDIVGYHSMSMQRYATELSTALHAVASDQWQLQDFVCYPAQRAVRLLPGKRGEQLASRLGRAIKYPYLASQARGDIFHILDQSHANLTTGLNPSRTVITCHDIIPLLAARNEIAVTASKFARYTFPLQVRHMRRCTRVIAISESTKRDLVRLAQIPEQSIKVVYYGVNKSFAPTPVEDASISISAPIAEAPLNQIPNHITAESAAVRKKHNLPLDAKIILHVGTQEHYKNTPALIKALGELNSNSDCKGNVWLLRVGAEFFPNEQELIDSLRLQDRIVHAGRVYGDEKLAQYYRTADVFAFPSWYEGFGWPPLEAMACGTPVVTSNVASLPEVVGEAGIMVAPDDFQSLAQGLHAVLTQDDLRQSLIHRGLMRAAKFTWEHTARNTLAVYEEVLAQA